MNFRPQISTCIVDIFRKTLPFFYSSYNLFMTFLFLDIINTKKTSVSEQNSSLLWEVGVGQFEGVQRRVTLVVPKQLFF